jgi:putative ABC transport system ATP-binding protein
MSNAAPETPLSLDCRQLTKTYGQRTVLHQLDLQLAAGDYVAIMGESGVGKSTLLNLIAGLDAPDTGSLHIAGTRLDAMNDEAATLLRREKLGFIFQAFHFAASSECASEHRVAAGLERLACRTRQRDDQRRRLARA